MAPPSSGALEIVNKSKYAGETVAVLVSGNAAELALRRQRDLLGHLNHLTCMPPMTVMHSSFDDSVETLEVALYHGPKHATADACCSGHIPDNFHHVKAYRVHCRGRNVLLKYKDGVGLEPQRGEANGPLGGLVGAGKKRSQGGGIDMKTNVPELELVGPYGP